jgi:opacity protein-like surface antigen
MTMRRAIKTLLVLGALALVLVPAQARADGFIAPWAGTNWGSTIDNGRGTFGITAGFMGQGIFGAEADFALSPSFFGSQNDFGHNSVATAMGNFIVGIPLGGTHGAGLRPYVSAGAGLLRTQLERGNDLFNISSSNNDLGWDAGAGVMGYFSQHVGLRGDFRYFRDTDDHGGGSANNLHFWRLGFGVTLR